MKLFGLEIRRVMQALPEVKQNQFEDVLSQLRAMRDGFSTTVTADTCMQAPTVHAIVTAISRRISVSPVHVYERGESDGRETKKRLPSHPVAKLLQRPNRWQTRATYWLDAASTYVRYGCYYAFKSRGSTGPIRELLPILPSEIEPIRNRDTWAVTYRRGAEELPFSRIHHARGPARDFLKGDSPVKDVHAAIALEILAEKFGSSFFQNGATPFLIFSFLAGNRGFKNDQESKQFVEDFQSKFNGAERFRAMLMPTGIDKPTPVAIENDKAQFLETRKYQRTVIAGAFGVPPHLVGDLERATFNNVEQQDSDFTLNVVMPVAQAFEAAMERDLLTEDDRAGGVIIRFNLDAVLRADFKSRQEGLQIQRQNGAISPNEWREIEGKNPISTDDGGEDYIRPANMVVAGAEPEPAPPSNDAAQRLLEEEEQVAEKVRASLRVLKGSKA